MPAVSPVGLVLVSVVLVPEPVGSVTVLLITYWYPSEPEATAVQLTVALVPVMALAARPVIGGQVDAAVVLNVRVIHAENNVLLHLTRTCA